VRLFARLSDTWRRHDEKLAERVYRNEADERQPENQPEEADVQQQAYASGTAFRIREDQPPL